MSFYKFITGFVALGTAACAAFFSVLGIATFLGGNFVEVAIMAGFLEAGKLVCASAAYRFRKVAAGWIRALLIVFTVVMMFITSTGIFGFLSSSYQKAAAEQDISQQKIENVRSKKNAFGDRISRLQQDRERLIETQNRLQDLQAEQGWLSQRQDQRLSEIPSELAEMDSTISATRDSVLSYEQQITELESQQSADSKLGPIVFVANTVGLPQDQAALYFILLLIFVFDPMAVTLVVALSMATGFEETVTEEEEEGEKVTLSELSEMTEEERKEALDDIVRTAATEEQKKQAATGKKSMTIRDVHEEKSMSNEEFNEQFTDPHEKMGDELRERRQPSEESKEAIEQAESGDLNEYEDVDDLREQIPEPLSPDERVQRMKDYASIGDNPEELYEDEDSRNKEQDESVEGRGEQEFEEWMGESSKDEEEKPWKNPFKPPFNK